MIIFMDKPEYSQLVSNKFYGREIAILNLSSLYSGYINITHLIANISPINTIGVPMPEFVDSYDFDMQYAAAIFNNPLLYESFINIILRSYEGQIVCILVQRDPYRDAVMESLIKLIQQRYGYNCWLIEEPDDIDIISEQMIPPNGIITLDNDISQYNQLCSKGIVNAILPNINIEDLGELN